MRHLSKVGSRFITVAVILCLLAFSYSAVRNSEMAAMKTEQVNVTTLLDSNISLNNELSSMRKMLDFSLPALHLSVDELKRLKAEKLRLENHVEFLEDKCRENKIPFPSRFQDDREI